MPRILVLEDQPMIAMMIEEWLTELGCETVGPESSVAGALALIDAGRLDGAILDVSLDGEDCYAVADRLRERAIPFAFATGHGADGIAERFKGSLVLDKPFDFEAVEGVVAAMTSER